MSLGNVLTKEVRNTQGLCSWPFVVHEYGLYYYKQIDAWINKVEIKRRATPYPAMKGAYEPRIIVNTFLKSWVQ